MRIAIEEIKYLQERLDEINKIPLTEIEFYENNEPRIINPNAFTTWAYVGMNNADFISTDYYKYNEGFTD